MIKVLFATSVADAGSYDYVTDGIFHGIKSRPEMFDVYECPAMSHLYKTRPCLHPTAVFGRRNLESEPNELVFDVAEKMILDKVFDLVVFDWRTSDPWWKERGHSPHYDMTFRLSEAAFMAYPKDRIIFLDGGDDPTMGKHDYFTKRFYGKSVYFKRELYIDNPEIHPISMSFAKERMLDYNSSSKEKHLAHVIPEQKETYIFKDEYLYYKDYHESMFGLTWKKLGWDCHRHYEILFSSCVPIFMDIKECPPRTMHFFPKAICQEVIERGILRSGWKKWQKYLDMYTFVNVQIDEEKIDMPWYSDVSSRLREHSMKYLTTENMSNYMLSKTSL